MREIGKAQSAFKASNGRYGEIAELGSAGLVRASLASGESDGYKFTIKATPDSYVALAVPISYGKNAYSGTGTLSFYLDQSGILRGWDKGGKEATIDDPALKLNNK